MTDLTVQSDYECMRKRLATPAESRRTGATMSRMDLRYLTVLMLGLAGCGGSGGLDSAAAIDGSATSDTRLASETATPKPWDDVAAQPEAPSQSVPSKSTDPVAQAPATSQPPVTSQPTAPSAGVIPAVPTGAPNLQQCPVDKTRTSANLASVLNEIRSMGENTWRKINLNTFDSVAQPLSLRPSCTSIIGHAGIINAWGSFAYDPNRGDLVTFGGGHADYCGNDIYRFRLSTMRWERAGLSSQMTGYQKTATEQWAIPSEGLAGAPATAHMYDGLMFLPVADRMAYFGYGTPSYAGTGGPALTVAMQPHTGPWFFDPSKADPNKVVGSNGSGVDPASPGGYMWENREYKSTHPGAWLPDGFGPQTASSDTLCENGKDVAYMRTAGASGVSSGLVKFSVNDARDPSKDVMVPVGAYSNHMAQADMAVDPARLVAVMLGDSNQRRFAFWDLSTPGLGNWLKGVNAVQDLTGGFDLGGNAGMDFDPVRGRFLLWNGESEVWELRLPATVPVPEGGWSVRRLQSIGGPTGALLPQSGGANGKWKYAPGLDVFLGLREAPNGDVWIYKPNGWVDPAR